MSILEIKDLDEHEGIVLALRPAYSAFTVADWASDDSRFTYHFYVGQEKVLSIDVFGKTLAGKIINHPELADMLKPFFDYAGFLYFDKDGIIHYWDKQKPNGPILFQYQLGTMGELDALVKAHNKQMEEA